MIFVLTYWNKNTILNKKHSTCSPVSFSVIKQESIKIHFADKRVIKNWLPLDLYLILGNTKVWRQYGFVQKKCNGYRRSQLSASSTFVTKTSLCSNFLLFPMMQVDFWHFYFGQSSQCTIVTWYFLVVRCFNCSRCLSAQPADAGQVDASCSSHGHLSWSCELGSKGEGPLQGVGVRRLPL